MFAAIISAFTLLFFALLFIFLLHFYTRCFLARDREIRDETQMPVIPFVFGARLYHHQNFATNDEQNTSPLIKGLGSSIPKFVFIERIGHGLECVICLSSFKNEEMGRKLTLCDHAFHVECIDMWLHSHTTCPICHIPAVKLSVYGEIVVDSSPEDEINVNEQILREFSGTISNLDEVREMNNEGFNRLEIIVEIPNREIEMNCTVHGKLHSSSGACP